MSIPAEQAEVAAFLEALAGEPPLETHVSAVFRGAETAWKLKKAVRLGYVDFTNLHDRRRLLNRELALNAPGVPGLYHDVASIARGPAGLALNGPGPVLDWVLRMARVPDADFLDRMAAEGRIGSATLRGLADAVAAMHGAQPLTRVADPVARFQAAVRGNAAAARAAGVAQADAWETGIEAAIARAAPSMQARAGVHRRAHGDLHLGNLLMWQGRPAPFDALEFDEELATIDPGYDLAFLLMDLDQRVSRAAANAVLNRYVARTGDVGLVAGLPAFLSLRATIRAHVAASRGTPSGALADAAMAYLRPGLPAVLAIGGLMGAGKSTLAHALAPSLGPAPGALVLRGDDIRKRLFGVAPETKLPPGAYDAEGHARTTAALLDGVRAAVAAGHAVIADTTFLDSRLRSALRAAAGPAPFHGIWLQAPLPVLEARVAARRNDASDADVAVLRGTAGWAGPPPGDWLLVDASGYGAEQQVRAALGML